MTSCGKRVQHFASRESGVAVRAHDPQNLQGGHQAVARGAEVAENQMAALFAAEIEAVVQHFINHVLIADGGANHLAAGGFDRRFQAGVAHHRGHQGFFGERFLREHVQRGDGHDVVAVNQRAGFVAEQHAVGVAVVRDAEVRPGVRPPGGRDFPGASSRNPC